MKKVYFDTNFLLRFYLADVPSQASKAKRMIEAAMADSLLLVTDLIVVCEMVWVMDSFYKLPKKVIQEKIINLYETPGISIINGEILPDALNVYVNQNIDFTDAMVGVSAARIGAEYVASFDKKHMDRLTALGLRRVETPEEVL
jgi:predicted nucleic-acid-binding protein